MKHGTSRYVPADPDPSSCVSPLSLYFHFKKPWLLRCSRQSRERAAQCSDGQRTGVTAEQSWLSQPQCVGTLRGLRFSMQPHMWRGHIIPSQGLEHFLFQMRKANWGVLRVGAYLESRRTDMKHGLRSLDDFLSPSFPFDRREGGLEAEIRGRFHRSSDVLLRQRCCHVLRVDRK